MPFPILISASCFQNVYRGGTVQNPGRFGPYGYNGAAYLFLTDQFDTTNPGRIRAFKATAAANYEDWAEVDAGNAPVVPSPPAGPLPSEPYGAVRHTTNPEVYVVHWSGATPFLAMTRFNMATDSWGSTVVSTLTYLSSNFGTETSRTWVPSVAYRSTDNSVWVALLIGIGASGLTRVEAAKILLSSDTWDAAFTQLGTADTTTVQTWFPVGMAADSTGRLHVLMMQICSGAGCVGGLFFSQLHHQAIKTDNTLGALTTIYDSGTPVDRRPQSISYLEISDDRMSFTYLVTGPTERHVVRAVAAEEPVFTDEIAPVMQSPNAASSTLHRDGLDYAFYRGVNQEGGAGDGFYYTTSPGIGDAWEDPGTNIGNDPAVDNNFVASFITALSFNPVGYTMRRDNEDGTFGQVFGFFGEDPPPAPTAPRSTTGGGARFFPRYLNRTLLSASLARTATVPAPISSWFNIPNDNDECLAREYFDYLRIDRTLLGCAKKPDCYALQNERDWVEAPPGAATFNPSDAIPLPDPVDGLTLIFSFRVPFGYDGILTGQYHGFTQAFLEGSGDLVWRVRVDGRFLRDMGNILSTLGSPQRLSPCPGGLWLHSGNLVEYLVEAPNTNGSLPLPGVGNILAGLHGWLFPRK